MPEVELSKDPLGAGRGATLKEQAGTQISRVRKHLHDKYYIPPYRPTNRNWEMTFASLGFNRKMIEKFWRIFCQINNCTGEIQLEHFLEHFDLDWTPWTKRAFLYFDTTGGGDIDFLEFMISVWNVCTFKIDSLSNFTFDMYDLDSDGELSIPEIEGMTKELFGEGGGQQCLAEAIEFAEARGGALNLNSFIAFTGSHQLLLFPMFQIQRKLQKRVFGIRFWEKIERASKENFNDRNKNEFNPRHVQILLRTYQTGGAAAVLSHTGDPNKGLREWYENQKKKDIIDETDLPDEPKMSRWTSVRNVVSSKRNILDGQAMKQKTIGRVRELKRSKPSLKRKAKSKHENAVDHGGNENDTATNERPSSALPANVAADLQKIRERRTRFQEGQQSTDEKGTPSTRTTSAVPTNVAEDLKRIREKKRTERVPPSNSGYDQAIGERPTSDIPANVAKSQQRTQRTPNDKDIGPETVNSNDNANESSTPARPTTADLPANVAADLQRIRARRTRRANQNDHRLSKVKRNDLPRSRIRNRNTAIQNSVRQRQAGSMFFRTDAQQEGQSKGWLE